MCGSVMCMFEKAPKLQITMTNFLWLVKQKKIAKYVYLLCYIHNTSTILFV